MFINSQGQHQSQGQFGHGGHQVQSQSQVQGMWMKKRSGEATKENGEKEQNEKVALVVVEPVEEIIGGWYPEEIVKNQK